MAKATKTNDKITVNGNGIKNTFPATLEDTPLFPYVQTLQAIPLDVLAAMPNTVSDNPRKADSVERNANRLAIEIAENGLLSALVVAIDFNGATIKTPYYARGAGRIAGLLKLREAMPAVFAKMFGKKGLIPCYSFVPADHAALVKIINDHSQTMALASKLELYEVHWARLAAGESARSVNIATQALMVPKGFTALNKAKELEKEALATTNVLKRRKLLKEAMDKRVQTFQGRIQDRNNERKLPYVCDVIRFHQSGDRPASGFLADTVNMPNNANINKNRGDIKDLQAAFKADGKEFDIDNPGPKYLAAWAKLVKVWESTVKVDKARSMSSKALAKLADETLKSKSLETVLYMAAQAVVSKDDEGKVTLVKADDDEAAAYLAQAGRIDSQLRQIEFAQSRPTLKAAWEDFLEQVQGVKASELKARQAKVKA